jgi:hypothetical protein
MTRPRRCGGGAMVEMYLAHEVADFLASSPDDE